MQTRNKLLTLASVLFFAGCQAIAYGTADDIEKLSIGMTKTEVVARLGTPAAAGVVADKGEEYLEYTRMAKVTGWSPTTYRVTLRNGKVVSYGER